MQPMLLPFGSERDRDIAIIHEATAIYTVPAEIEGLLDRLDWPRSGGRLLDPGAGNGGLLVAALARLDLAVNDISAASAAVKGYEFHPGAAYAARCWIESHLVNRCWSRAAATAAATAIVEERDFLLAPVPVGAFQTIAMNPPYLRKANIPGSYRLDFDLAVPTHAQADLLFAYLQRAADVIAPGGMIGLIAADRLLLNASSGELRRRIGQRYAVRDVRRLDAASAFYRPKTRRRGTPARVHPVSLILDPSGIGSPMTSAPFPLDGALAVDGVLLSDLAEIRLAPWLGPEGIFVVRDPAPFPADSLVPVVEPDDIDAATDRLTGFRRWALKTTAEPPPAALRAHLERTLDRMPARGRRRIPWLPPETFAGRLPLECDAVLIPRIAKRLRPILLPGGYLPINHNLVVLSGLPADQIIGWLNDPRVQEQARGLALRLENDYLSITATTLRRLTIPHDLVTSIACAPPC